MFLFNSQSPYEAIIIIIDLISYLRHGNMKCKVCPESVQLCNMKNGDIYWRYKIQETLYKGQWCLSPLQLGTLGPHTVLSIAINCPIVFSWISLMVWNLFPFKGDFSFVKKPEVAGHEFWAVWGLSHLGDLMFHQKSVHQTWCMSRCFVMIKLWITNCL